MDSRCTFKVYMHTTTASSPQAKNRFVAAPPIFQIKIVDKDGVREVKKV